MTAIEPGCSARTARTFGSPFAIVRSLASDSLGSAGVPFEADTATKRWVLPPVTGSGAAEDAAGSTQAAAQAMKAGKQRTTASVRARACRRRAPRPTMLGDRHATRR